MRLADLAVSSLTIETPSGNLCNITADDLWLQLEIVNQGEADAGQFIIEVNGNRQQVPDGLAAGKRIVIGFRGYQYRTSVRLDVTDQVKETNEANNLHVKEMAQPTRPVICFVTPTPQVAVAQPLSTLKGHTGAVTSVAFSPDGNLVASGSSDNTLRLWRVTQGVLLRTMTGHPFPILDVVFSPNGGTLATASSDGIVRVWQVSNGALLDSFTGHGGRVTSVAFAPDSRTLASGSEDYTVRLWNLVTGRLTLTIDEGMASVNCLAFSPDGNLLAWGEQDGHLRLWKVVEGAWLNIVRLSNEAITSLAFSPDGTWLATGTAQGMLYILRVADGKVVHQSSPHTQAITGLAYSPDGNWFVTASREGILRLWQVRLVQEVTLPVGTTPTPGTLPPPIATATYPPVNLQLTLSRLLRGHAGPVTSVAYSPRGNLIASGSEDQTIRLWEPPGSENP